jgi:hypothetical protein
LAYLPDDVGSPRDVSGVVEDGIAQKHHVAHCGVVLITLAIPTFAGAAP